MCRKHGSADYLTYVLLSHCNHITMENYELTQFIKLVGQVGMGHFSKLTFLPPF